MDVDVGARLRAVQRFVDAAAIVCEESSRLGVHETYVMLIFEGGPVAVAVDNSQTMFDENRLYGMTSQNWQVNPILIAMRDRAVIWQASDPSTFFEQAKHYGYTGDASIPFALPLVSPSGWFGTVAHASRERIGEQVERELALIATQLSVWCTAQGISTIPRELLCKLGPRQYRIAQLAARGLQNGEIAAELGISINTVKARLKEVFERLAIHDRAELAPMLARLAPLDDIPPGVTHLGAITTTRAP